MCVQREAASLPLRPAFDRSAPLSLSLTAALLLGRKLAVQLREQRVIAQQLCQLHARWGAVACRAERAKNRAKARRPTVAAREPRPPAALPALPRAGEPHGAVRSSCSSPRCAVGAWIVRGSELIGLLGRSGYENLPHQGATIALLLQGANAARHPANLSIKACLQRRLPSHSPAQTHTSAREPSLFLVCPPSPHPTRAPTFHHPSSCDTALAGTALLQ